MSQGVVVELLIIPLQLYFYFIWLKPLIYIAFYLPC